MGLKSAIQSAVSAVFTSVGDLKTSITYVRYSANPTYNPATGAVTSTTTSSTVYAILVKYKRNEVDGNKVLESDMQAIIKQSDLAFTPKLEDYLTISSVNWNVISIQEDPANAIWMMQIRRA